MAADDPRPLLGEPLSLDLLNTRWRLTAETQDLLTDVAGLAIWLRANDLHELCPADEPTLAAVRQARTALTAAVAHPAAPGRDARAAVNAVLSHGRTRRTLTADGPAEEAVTDSAAWLPGWLAVDDYLRLLRLDPTRIRGCANDSCLLHFFDTSQNRRRRWCSMALCGNRAKAARHYARGRAAG
ncbi:CGNR zinc finger domain-containing protein [Streptomyces sp. DSM 44915]|uniref:CGNR zinc finger domain-containing protein n=1 Tax=Streptomyces chisholmiae TaxID=3075540 RepID=A0ABU2JPW4_9ACTN|nr:CGNR zinc finger domain-containing protein [Streptomyces sp. DSM 44915]MDT0266766.1 CGNR zinc finger domain-containing protein [Streptomyces sp. DSM 44915]